MFIPGQCSIEQIINTSRDDNGDLEYILVLYSSYVLYKIEKRSYGLSRDRVPYNEKTLSIIDKLRKAPIVEIPMELIEKII